MSVDYLQDNGAHKPWPPQGRSLCLFLLHEAPRSIATPPWMGAIPCSPVPIYTLGKRETKWSKTSCLRKQCDCVAPTRNLTLKKL